MEFEQGVSGDGARVWRTGGERTRDARGAGRERRPNTDDKKLETEFFAGGKKFHVDAIQNSRGSAIKLKELSDRGDRIIIIPLDGLEELRQKLTEAERALTS